MRKEIKHDGIDEVSEVKSLINGVKRILNSNENSVKRLLQIKQIFSKSMTKQIRLKGSESKGFVHNEIRDFYNFLNGLLNPKEDEQEINVVLRIILSKCEAHEKELDQLYIDFPDTRVA